MAKGKTRVSGAPPPAEANDNPVAGAQACELGTIQTTPGAEVDVLQSGARFELSELQQARKPAVVAIERLALDEQAHALFEGQSLSGALGHLLGERRGHAVQFQAVQ